MGISLRTVERRVLPVAPWLLVASLTGALLLLLQDGQRNMLDLRVYHDAPPWLLTGRLYDFTYSEFTPDFPLPFTYPPFAAIALLPLSALPWTLARVLWYVGLLACLWYLVRGSLRLVAGDRWDSDPGGWERRAMVLAAVVLWAEPIRFNFYFGQINLPLAALLLAGLTRLRQPFAGGSVGLAAGVKLTPAISGLYFLAFRQWKAVAWSIAAFATTVGLGWLASPDQSRRFWLELLGDADRVGPIASATNQSLRGALSRTLGHDVGFGTTWLLAVVAVAVLAGFALRAAARERDPLAVLTVVQILGLLISPISWSHHWVWVVPAVVWLVFGPARRHPLARAAVAAWVLAVGTFVITFLLDQQPTIWTIPRPWYLSALGWAYPLCSLLTLGAVAALAPLRALRPRSRPGDAAPGRDLTTATA
ncbi:polyprenol-phosphate-mannose-dependent alpha-(1-2)-phosphatidylinositol pentamannoside mannosyltransferase [Longimycelium tulufanense]|uniref:Polyprenol-phosphate-mannose-dependent alpha-(1-2)-phosphatidylinositol pentamannoside mannosyltransferase n=1 Tax=Longimycelium tulufanense TaxID=907463 RepID=A0A8J3FW60_9PSEU|nr:mannosyltransferase [Longimycelium tulufanense]GGM69286.1 polyprenol-phosphate-mannose-dependent alpha-(1-2)-phosphatidylinositol pentamannoside mannosyltransferase [Longimycelium tulufanense]